MNFIPRDYQQNAVTSIYGFFRAKRGNPLVVAPTGSGKSVIQAMFVRDAITQWPNTRIILATHVKELLVQNGDWVDRLCSNTEIGYLSAGMNKRDYQAQILLAGIQTAHRHTAKIGKADLIVIDEAHLINEDDGSMYQKFISNLKSINPHIKVIGLTATPYRMSSGLLYGKDDSMFDGVAYDIPIGTLIERGELCRLTGRRGVTHVDLSEVHIRAGEFKADELEAVFDADITVKNICKEIVAAGENSKGVLIFASGVKHAHHMAEYLRHLTGERVEVVDGKTPKLEREKILGDYKAREYRYLVNMGVLTTGFDAPHIDLLALCRATKSTGLYVQIMGRGMRPYEGKDRCIVLDYGGNIERHGPVDAIEPRDVTKGPGEGEAPIKECPECLALLHTSIRICPDCGHEFPKPKPNLERTASDAAIMSDEAIDEIEVYNITYTEHRKRDKASSMKVTYDCKSVLFDEWICFDHAGFARKKAEQWAIRRRITPPASVKEALELDWPTVSSIVVDTSGKYSRVMDVTFGPFKRDPLEIDMEDYGTWSQSDEKEAEEFM